MAGSCTNLGKCDGVNYICGNCRKNFPFLAMQFDEKRRQKKQVNSNRQRGGTMGSTNFRSVPQRNDPSVTNHLFNTPGDGAAHGHVKEQQNPDGSTSYPYIRDVEGTEYDAS